MSGYSGGGKALIERFESDGDIAFRDYGLAMGHKHVPEIMKYGRVTRRPLFVPAVGNFDQGMLVELPLHLDLLPGRPTTARLLDAYRQHYAGGEWVSVEQAPESGKLDAVALKDTDRLEIRVFGNDEAAQAVCVARLDNLGKGASGAAVQNLRLMLGL